MNSTKETDPVLAVEDERFRAMVAGDIPALERLLPPDLHYVHANGMIEGKAEFIRKIVSAERLYRKFEATNRAIHREAGFAFVFGRAEVEVDRHAGRLQNTLTYTAIYRQTSQPSLFAWHAVRAID